MDAANDTRAVELQIELAARRSPTVAEQLAIELIRTYEARRAAGMAEGSLDAAAAAKLEFLVFATCTFAGEQVSQRGELARSHQWITRAIADPLLEHGEELRKERTLFWGLASYEQFGPHAVEVCARWYTLLYSYATAAGHLNGLAEDLWDNSGELVDELSASAPRPWLIFMIGHRAHWASRYDPDEARAAFAHLPPLLDDPELDPMAAMMIRTIAMSCEVQLTDESQEVWARKTLDKDGDRLSAPWRLRALTTVCGGREADLVEHLDEIVAAAQAHRHFGSPRETAITQAYRRADDARAVSWPLRTLALAGRSDEALRLLRAWLPKEPPGRPLQRPLFLFSAVEHGAIWCAEGKAAPSSSDSHSDPTFDDLNRVSRAALRTDIQVRADFVTSDAAYEEGAGIPNEQLAGEYATACRRHLDVARLSELDDAVDDRSVVVPWPIPPAPVQALMRKDDGRVFPLSASLCEPAPCRRIERVALLGSGSLTSQLERDAVAGLLREHGIAVDVVEQATASSFGEVYSDRSYDALWLCSHGTYDHMRPHESTLDFDDGGLMSLEDLARLPAPSGEQRRLLMLNVCDGAASAILGGSMALGIATTLAGPQQSVVAHLWPVHFIAALAFGVLLAGRLAVGDDHLAAYSDALGTLGRGYDGVLAALRELGPSVADVTTRIEQSSHDWSSIFTWGSPGLVV